MVAVKKGKGGVCIHTPCFPMNSLPLPSASPKAKEPSDDASETAPMPKSNAGMTEQQQQQQEEEAPAKNSVLDTSAILFENAEIEHKYNKEHLADSEFHRGASISVVSTSRPTRLTIFIPELTGMSHALCASLF
jgi:hypothetical protein